MPETILVTGGAGFIGSNFIEYFCRKYPQYHVINFDKLTYAANQGNLRDLAQFANYSFVQGDLADKDAVNALFAAHQIRGVVHFAAESHVDNSIKNPGAFISSNLVGTFNLLEAARHAWMEAPHQVKSGCESCRFHHISTDEVYGTLGSEGSFSETTPYAPNSPYSASKAGSDFLVRAYFHTYGLNVTTSNCSNNYGPRQHSEKLIPHTISMALKLKPIPVYGNGLNVRDWLYVLDHCKAVDLIFHQGASGETYNVGGRNEVNNITIVKTICALLDELEPRRDDKKYGELITFVTDRPGHDFRYAINPNKICSELHWAPDETFASGIRKTVEWYLSHRDFLA
ncbi:MAG: dTDP-glucose 4,6-dehydratase [Proteobacteria bacterium]|uniref:dTDP-glucose 4,6-dehydratase n=1 Tax=Candidatus Avisuccinivibrio stercorigallinarum TaxID=2840704 RepID=A0A9D9DDP0_9GAMM|nr:dTDP-glucose 4,6-dehydratase [Candidatus Avisuccinivibrio stercorigallinarum]